MLTVISSPELFIGMSMLSINAWVKHVFHIKQILVALIELRAFPERLCQDLPVVNPLWRGPGSIHGFVLDRKSYRQG